VVLVALSLVSLCANLRSNRRLSRSLSATITSLQRQATHDHLTDLPNRAAFLSELAEAVACSETIGIMFTDVDQFKAVNDNYGHSVGDTLLRELSQRFTATLGANNVVARIGGDEFVMLVRCLDSDEQLAATAERVRRRANERIVAGDATIFPTLSIGLLRWSPEDGLITPDELLHRADLALYAAKRSGRDRATTYTPAMSQVIADKIAMASELRRAIEFNEFEVYYQPTVELATGRILGAEALLRWNHESHGLCAPDVFLDVAEETGLLVEIGRTALLESCRRFANLNSSRPDQDLSLTVNIAESELLAPGFRDFVEQALADSGLPGTALICEVREGVLTKDISIEAIESLQRLGVRLSLDDFGTGYSSLVQLRRFGVDQMKIARTFVAGVGINPADTAIVGAICDLGSGIGIEIVAEGVENQDQQRLLSAMGCRLGHGYLLGHPQTFTNFLKTVGRSEHQDLAAPVLTNNSARGSGGRA
jgi:diguanylate cyclase (GGDEF)-like protein